MVYIVVVRPVIRGRGRRRRSILYYLTLRARHSLRRGGSRDFGESSGLSENGVDEEFGHEGRHAARSARVCGRGGWLGRMGVVEFGREKRLTRVTIREEDGQEWE